MKMKKTIWKRYSQTAVVEAEHIGECMELLEDAEFENGAEEEEKVEYHILDEDTGKWIKGRPVSIS